MTVDESRFSDSFRAAYTTAFSEYLRMCTVTSTRLIEGKQSGIEEKLASRMLTILIALENDHLTDKEIEALEYCLLQLTMVTTPTLDPIVTVSPEAPTVVNYQIHANAGIFSLIGQDAAFTLTHAIVFEFGSFSLAGQDATFLLTHSFVADQGSFILTGQAATFLDKPSFVAKGTKDDAVNAASVGPTYPAGITAGMIIFVLGIVNDSTGEVQTPTGFSNVSEYAQTGIATNVNAYLFYKVADGTESGVLTVNGGTLSGGLADYLFAQIYVYQGNNLAIADTDSTKGTAATLAWDAVSVGNDYSTLLAFVVNWDAAASPDSPSGYTLDATDGSTAISGTSVEVSSKQSSSSGASTTAANGSSNGWATWHVSIHGSY